MYTIIARVMNNATAEKGFMQIQNYIQMIDSGAHSATGGLPYWRL